MIIEIRFSLNSDWEPDEHWEYCDTFEEAHASLDDLEKTLKESNE